MSKPHGKSPVHMYVIIPAAGQSRRMGGTSNKQLIPIGGIPVLAMTLLAFENFQKGMNEVDLFCLHGIVVTAPEAIADIRRICDDYRISFVEQVVVGGKTRQESVWNGVCALSGLSRGPDADDVVQIHDGARCFVDFDTILRCYHGALENGICTAAVPVKDTIKQVDSAENARVMSTPDRSTLYAVQTPQSFTYDLLAKSYAAGQEEKRSATDDTSLAEAIGLPVFLVEGTYANIKITTQDDLLWAELLRTRRTDVVQ